MTRRLPLRRVLVVAIALCLAAATAFGLWHLVVGGLVSGNPRAASFGAILAAGAGALLLGWIAVVRRRLLLD